MLNNQKTVFVCNDCGYTSAKWSGKCPCCGQGNTMVEEICDKSTKKSYKNITKYENPPIKACEIEINQNIRYKTNMPEFDKLLGGGLVKGSLILLGGAPGIGKSTLLLQICNNIQNIDVIYISGEESGQQIKMRALRLSLDLKKLFILTETDIEKIIFYIKKHNPGLVIIDSIQTICKQDITSLPGSISQVKECANILLEFTKKTEISMIIVSHINKDGVIAGPKVLEHIVDVVLYFDNFSK